VSTADSGAASARRTRLIFVLVAALLVVVLAAGVVVLVVRGRGPTNAVPPLDTARLKPGACASVAGALADSHQLIGDLVAGVATPEMAVAPLAAAQKTLDPLSEDPEIGAAVSRLVDRIGRLRFGVPARRVNAAVIDDLRVAQADVEGICLQP